MTIATLELIHELLKRERDAKKEKYRIAIENHRDAVEELEGPNGNEETVARLKAERDKARDEYHEITDALNDFESREW